MVNRLRIAENDPEFGWHYVLTFTATCQHLPNDVNSKWMRRAWRHEMGQHDQVVTAALVLHHPTNQARHAIRACLIDPEFDYKKTAERLRLPAEVIECFGELFFNVRDRLDDGLYLTNVIYPDGRYATMKEGYAEIVGNGELMLRAAFHYGAEEALKFGGFTRSLDTRSTLLEETGKLERNTIVAANLALAAGLGGQRYIPAIAAGRASLNAAKQGGGSKSEVTSVEREVIGLSAITPNMTLGAVMLEEITKLNPEAAQRQSEFMKQLSEMKQAKPA